MNEIQLSVKTLQWRFSLELFVAGRYTYLYASLFIVRFKLSKTIKFPCVHKKCRNVIKYVYRTKFFQLNVHFMLVTSKIF